MTERLDISEERGVCWEGSWGATKRVPRTMRITAWVDSERKRGGFEVYDENSAGEEFYGEGGLWLSDRGYLCDYDGVGSLDLAIIEWLDTLGHINPDPTCWYRREISPKEASA